LPLTPLPVQLLLLLLLLLALLPGCALLLEFYNVPGHRPLPDCMHTW
jgi:hypothetical protein